MSQSEANGNEFEPESAIPHVPDFELLRPIGQGGFGQVWLAANRATGRLRAVKLIPRHGLASDPAGREVDSLIRLEAKLRHQHPNLVSIHHVGKTDRFLFYAMELADDVSGRADVSTDNYQPATLEARLQTGPLPPQQCLAYGRQLLAGLASLHEAGMVHRDIKPANCLFVAGALKLADFGLLTDTGPYVSRVGTEKYMPPDGHMDVRADVYAAGLVLYEMVTGLPADAFPRLGSRAKEIAEDAELRGLVRLSLQACQPEPPQRFTDAGQMLEALSACQEARTTATRPRHARTAGLLALGMLLLTAAGIWFARPLPPQPPRTYVNFVTEPFEATILLDGKPVEVDGAPSTTPCTVEDLPARTFHVEFRHEGLPDLDAGYCNFAETRQITGRWEDAKAGSSGSERAPASGSAR